MVRVQGEPLETGGIGVATCHTESHGTRRTAGCCGFAGRSRSIIQSRGSTHLCAILMNLEALVLDQLYLSTPRSLRSERIVPEHSKV